MVLIGIVTFERVMKNIGEPCVSRTNSWGRKGIISRRRVDEKERVLDTRPGPDLTTSLSDSCGLVIDCRGEPPKFSRIGMSVFKRCLLGKEVQ